MRLVRYTTAPTSNPRVGVQLGIDGPVADVIAVDPSVPNCMKEVLAGGEEMLSKMRAAAVSARVFQPGEYTLHAPIARPEKVMCIGMNYVDHCTEQNFPIPKEPIVFSKFSSSVTGPNADVVFDSNVTQQMDFEVEMVIVIGKEGKYISQENAMDHVAGYTVAHDVSARDWQMKRNGAQWLLGKTMDAFCPIGPAIVTKDGLDPNKLGLRCRLNGETVQDSNTDQLIFKTEYLVEWVSQFVTIMPGDIILTGTPPGVGCFRKPPLWLKNGDVVECEIDGIGTIKNNIIDVPTRQSKM